MLLCAKKIVAQILNIVEMIFYILHFILQVSIDYDVIRVI